MHSCTGGTLRSALSIAIMLSTSTVAVAETGLGFNGLEIGGFGTLGALQTNSDDVDVTRDQSQQHGAKTSPSLKQDSLIGVQAYLKANDSLEFLVQGVSRYGPRGDYRPELMAAHARYAATPNLSVRAGRIGMEFYMLADSRLVGYSYLTVRPPREIFTALPFQYVRRRRFHGNRTGRRRCSERPDLSRAIRRRGACRRRLREPARRPDRRRLRGLPVRRLAMALDLRADRVQA
ncbi:MAG: hypothetical protein QM739_19510 [Propionivibrio sp.]